MQMKKKYHLRQKCLFCSSLFHTLGVHSFPNKGSLQCSLQGNLKRDITGRANRKVFSSSFLPPVLPSQATHVCFGIEKDLTAEECKSRITSFRNNSLKSSSSASPWVTLEFLRNKMSCFPLDKSRSVCYGYKCSKQRILTSLSHSSISLRVVESILQCPVQHIQS